MGASNVAAAYAFWGRLPHLPFRLLVYMALTSLDRDDPPRFWGGRDDLAHALGRVLPREPDREDQSAAALQARSELHNARTAVKSGVRVLLAEGAIEVLRPGRFGSNAEYGLRLQGQAHPAPVVAGTDRPQGQAHPAPGEQAHPAPMGQAHPAAAAGSPCSQGQAHPAPKEKSGSTGTPTGEDRPEKSPYQDDSSALEDLLILASSDGPPARFAAEAADTEHPMLRDPEDPAGTQTGSHGRDDWHPLAAAAAIGRVVELGWTTTTAGASALLDALAADRKAKTPGYLTTRTGFDRAKVLLHQQTQDPEVTANGRQLGEMHRQAVTAARSDLDRRNAALTYLESLDRPDRQIVVEAAEHRARQQGHLQPQQRVPQPLMLSAVAALLERPADGQHAAA